MSLTDWLLVVTWVAIAITWWFLIQGWRLRQQTRRMIDEGAERNREFIAYLEARGSNGGVRPAWLDEPLDLE